MTAAAARAGRCAVACCAPARPSSPRSTATARTIRPSSPSLYAALEQAGPTVGLAQGQRIGRKGAWKQFQSWIANGVRGKILKDATRDTGCGLKVFRREVYLTLPYFDALHRFMPALVTREGFDVVHRDVVDRPRFTGHSNYGMFDRLWVGILDLAGVWWLIRRRRPAPRAEEIPHSESR